MTKPFHITPFPMAQVGRTLIQQLIGMGGVIGPPLPISEGDAMKVESTFRPPALLLFLIQTRCEVPAAGFRALPLPGNAGKSEPCHQNANPYPCANSPP